LMRSLIDLHALLFDFGLWGTDSLIQESAKIWWHEHVRQQNYFVLRQMI
jgi:hypothetical protein